MNQPSRRKPGRIFPDFQISEEERAKREAESKARRDRAFPVFDKLRSELIETHYGWFVTIELETGEYFIAEKSMTNLKAAREKYPNSIFCTFCINETGACGRI